MNFYAYIRAKRFGISADAAINYTEHDNRYHDGRYDPVTMTCKMRDAVLAYNERTGEFYACVPFLVPVESEPQHEEKCLGVDLGIKRIATLSDGRLNFVGRHRQQANRGKGHARPASPQALAVGS